MTPHKQRLRQMRMTILDGLRKQDLTFDECYQLVKDIGTEQIAAVNQFATGLEGLLGISFSEAQRSKFPKVKLAQWAPKAGGLVALLRRVAGCPADASAAL